MATERNRGRIAPRAPERAPAERRRRRSFLAACMRALRDPGTYRLRSNAGLWAGFLVALPVPIVSLSSSNPTWIDLLALATPLLCAAVLGATARVAGLGEREIRRVTSDAADASLVNAAEQLVLRGTADSQRTERERLEALQGLMDSELALARDVNRSLVPPEILLPGLEVVVRQIPHSFVGGDYLHAALPRPDLLYLCVGDVSGHGVSAALVVSRFHGLVQQLVLERREPAYVIAELNRAMVVILEHTSIFLTFAVFRVDLAASRIDYATAGHPPQFLLRGDGTVERLSTPNGLLGSRHEDVLGPLGAASVPYGPGDTLVLFTDGLFEVAPRSGHEMLGEGRLSSLLVGLASSPPQRIASELLRNVTEFRRVGPFEDDVSLMVARFGPAVPRAPDEDVEERSRPHPTTPRLAPTRDSVPPAIAHANPARADG